MSHRKEIMQLAVRIPRELFPDELYIYGDQYIYLTLGGDNNCIAHDTNQFSRSWTLQYHGDHSDIITNCLKHEACSTEGGTLQSYRGWFTPEGYIKKVRKTLDEAITLDEFRQIFFGDIVIAYSEDDINEYAILKTHCEYMRNTYQFKVEPCWYDKRRIDHIFKVNTSTNQGIADLFAQARNAQYINFDNHFNDDDKHYLTLVKNLLFIRQNITTAPAA